MLYAAAAVRLRLVTHSLKFPRVYHSLLYFLNPFQKFLSPERCHVIRVGCRWTWTGNDFLFSSLFLRVYHRLLHLLNAFKSFLLTSSIFYFLIFILVFLFFSVFMPLFLVISFLSRFYSFFLSFLFSFLSS